MRKKGFTIIELLMVVAILATLLGIITTAVFASIRQARDRRTQAMRQTIQNGIAAYRQLKDRWPGDLEDLARDPPPSRGTVSAQGVRGQKREESRDGPRRVADHEKVRN